MIDDIENLKKRLIYRSQYRGTKEMDKLVGSFVRSNIDILDLSQLKELEKFLNVDDDSLYKLYNKQISEINSIDDDIIKLFKNYIYKK